MIYLEAVLLVYFSYTTLYTSVLFIAGWFYRDKKFSDFQKDRKFRFCVLIPAYKEDGVILSVAKAALTQNYPKDLFKVVVIADSLKESTMTELSRLPIELIEVHFDQSTKVKSINAAFDRLPNEFDYAIILDADNIMEDNFILKMNRLHNDGVRAVQAQRIAKNSDTDIAILDGISEAINYRIFSQGYSVLGGSPGIKGSGMSFDFPLIKETFSQLASVGGFDRELELKLIEQNIRIYYSAETVLRDEKVNSMAVFKRQRTRWVASQFYYLRKYFLTGLTYLFKGNFVFFDSAILRNIQLPRLLNISSLVVTALLLYLIKDVSLLEHSVWILLVLVNCCTIAFAIPKSFFDRRMVLAIMQLPGILGNMFSLLFRLNGANKRFIHTPHGAPASDNTKQEQA